MRDETIQDAHRVGLDDELVMLGVEMPRDTARFIELVECRLVEADREGLDACAGGARHQRHHRARVDTTGEKCAQGDIAHQMRADGAGQNVVERRDGVVLRAVERFPVGKLPVLLDLDPAVGPRQQVPRRQLLHGFEDRPIARGVKERQIVIERVEIDLA